jgi:hypothetical protein
VPIGKVEQVHTFVQLNCRAEQVKLHAAEDRVRAWIPTAGAM